MNTFSRGFNFGFSVGLFNSSFGSFNPFFGSCCNFNFGYQTPMFFAPIFNFNNFTPYFTPQPMFSGWNNFNIPKFTMQNINTGWHNNTFYTQTFTPTITLGDTFTRTVEERSEERKEERTENNKENVETVTTDKPVKSSNKNETQNKITTRKTSDPETSVNTSTQTQNKKTSTTTTKNKNWTNMTDTELRETYGDYDKDITTLYTGTAENLNKYLEDKGALRGLGEAFMKAQEEHGISASVLVGICMNETNRGKDKKGYSINNIGGVREFVNGKAKWKEYNSKEDCIMHMASFLKSGYVNNSTRSLTKLYEINSRYCPVTDPTDNDGINRFWATNVNKYTQEAENVQV